MSTTQPLLTGALLGAVIFCGALVLLRVFPAPSDEQPAIDDNKALPDPRDFTLDQLRGQTYVAIKGEVFDVSSGPYGPGGAYANFAGHDISRCLAKMSVSDDELDRPYDDLSHGEREALDEWYTTFKHVKNYPCLGRLSTPPSDLRFTLSSLLAAAEENRGPPPPGRIHPPLLIAVRGQVYDVSYGGVELYGPSGPYAKFVGRDASRALATMSLDEETVANPSIADLDDKAIGVLDDWAKLFHRKYPQVGTCPTSS